jgi:NAD+ kinase
LFDKVSSIGKVKIDATLTKEKSMTLPIDLVLVRHGQSEGNLAKRLSEAGQHGTFAKVSKDRHTRSFRLTKTGRSQAERTGEWLRGEFFEDSYGFDRYYTYEYVRAMETSALLGLPRSEWFSNFYLTERNWGDLDKYDEAERAERFERDLRMRDIEPFFWGPPNGETFADVCLRLDRVLYTLHRECTDKRVIIVCHGEVMWAFRVLLERMPQLTFKELHLSKRPEERIQNWPVLHYTRRDPVTRKLAGHANWMRMIRPTDTPAKHFGWQPILRPRFSNAQLHEIVKQYPPILN